MCNDRLADEMPERREARQQDLSDCQRDRLADETPERREARQQDLSDRQRDRLADETPERREARLLQYRESYRSVKIIKNQKRITFCTQAPFCSFQDRKFPHTSG